MWEQPRDFKKNKTLLVLSFFHWWAGGGGGGAWIPKWTEFPPNTSLRDRLRLSTPPSRRAPRLVTHPSQGKQNLKIGRNHPLLRRTSFFSTVCATFGSACPAVLRTATLAQLRWKLLSWRPCCRLQQVRDTLGVNRNVQLRSLVLIWVTVCYPFFFLIQNGTSEQEKVALPVAGLGWRIKVIASPAAFVETTSGGFMLCWLAKCGTKLKWCRWVRGLFPFPHNFQRSPLWLCCRHNDAAVLPPPRMKWTFKHRHGELMFGILCLGQGVPLLITSLQRLFKGGGVFTCVVTGKFNAHLSNA